MSINFYLYRRLSRWITCELNLPGKSKIALHNKYEVASFQDVFCHPFYWRVYDWIHDPPKLVIDCGANCGHFSILSDLCLRAKFGSSNTEYILIEPNPFLIPLIHKNISDAELSDRVEVKQAILGNKLGYSTLWVNSKNYLTSSLHPTKGAQPHIVEYLDLLKVARDRKIDLLKIDIEGGEFEFVRSNLDLLTQVNLIFMELHQAPQEMHEEIFASLKLVGLHLATKPIESNGQKLVIFHRPVTPLT